METFSVIVYNNLVLRMEYYGRTRLGYQRGCWYPGSLRRQIASHGIDWPCRIYRTLGSMRNSGQFNIENWLKRRYVFMSSPDTVKSIKDWATNFLWAVHVWQLQSITQKCDSHYVHITTRFIPSSCTIHTLVATSLCHNSYAVYLVKYVYGFVVQQHNK